MPYEEKRPEEREAISVREIDGISVIYVNGDILFSGESSDEFDRALRGIKTEDFVVYVGDNVNNLDTSVPASLISHYRESPLSTLIMCGNVDALRRIFEVSRISEDILNRRMNARICGDCDNCRYRPNCQV